MVDAETYGLIPLVGEEVAMAQDLSQIVLAPATEDIDYPETDGQPMGESEIHILAILHLLQALRHLFRERPDVYVAADLFLYYEEGNKNARKAPDVMVVKGVDRRLREVYKLWEEKVAPCLVFEITSRSSWWEDLVSKSSLYSSLGVREYILFDPRREYLEEPLIGFRLEGREYTRIPLAPDGSLFSAELGTTLRIEGDLLRVVDPQTGQYIPDLTEAILAADAAMQQAEAARRQAEEEARRAEEEARRAEEEARRAEQEARRAEEEARRAEEEARRAEEEARRAAIAEAEVARLRALLKRADDAQ